MRYGVIGVPSLVLINPRNGRTVSYNASDYVDKYPNGEGFPWPDISFVDTLKGDYFQKLDKLGETNYKLWTQRDICKFKTVILYFLRGDKLVIYPCTIHDDIFYISDRRFNIQLDAIVQ